jgi:hypothetical protein
MLCVSKTYHRSSPDIDWFQPTKDFVDYRRGAFFKTGKIKEVTAVESSDKLSISILTIFADASAKTDYEADASCVASMNSRSTYNSLNEIYSEPAIVTIVG